MPWWDDLRVAGSARTTGPNAASLANVNSTGIYAWRFTNGKELFFGGQLPHRYQLGSPISAHVHWLADTTETYTGTWTLDYLWANPTQAAPISNKITLTGSISGSQTALVPKVTALTPELAHAFTISALLLCRLSLSLSAGTGIFLLEFDFHHECDSLGSPSEWTK